MMPARVNPIPANLIGGMVSPNITQLMRNTNTVFRCPITWNDTAENLPRHENCDILTSIAKEHDRANANNACEFHVYEVTQDPPTM